MANITLFFSHYRVCIVLGNKKGIRVTFSLQGIISAFAAFSPSDENQQILPTNSFIQKKGRSLLVIFP